jgi:hypothetical protein
MVAPPFMDTSYQCESDHPPRNLEVVEVAPVDQPTGAVEALKFYADPATWDHISARGTVTTNTPAARDNGERARRALGGQ